MRSTLSAIALATLGLLLAGELLCRMLPVSTATETSYYIDPLVRTYPARHRWITSTGWDLRRPQRMSANNDGFAAEHDFVVDPHAVALIGDSYVEASMLPMRQRLAHRLEAALGSERRVYAMGSPGTSLLDYAERVRLAHQRYGVRDMVLLVEAGDVLQSLCGSGNVDASCLDPNTFEHREQLQPSASMAARWGRHSALAQYLFSQLRFDLHKLRRALGSQLKPGASVEAPAGRSADLSEPPRLAAIDAVAAAFQRRVSAHVEGRLVLLLDGDRGETRTTRRWNPIERRHFANRMLAMGATVIDLEPAYAAHRLTSRLSLEVSPRDAHLNSLGLAVVAKAAARALKPD